MTLMRMRSGQITRMELQVDSNSASVRTPRRSHDSGRRSVDTPRRSHEAPMRPPATVSDRRTKSRSVDFGKSMKKTNNAVSVPWERIASPERRRVDPVRRSKHREARGVHDYYEFRDELGRGTYGTVYKASEVASGRDVAVKKIVNDSKGRWTSCNSRREVKILEDMQGCDSVVKLERAFEDERETYIVTEICRGGDLQDFLRNNGPVNEEQAAVVAFEILTVLRECHRRHVLHGDVKAANFVIDSRIDHQLLKHKPNFLRRGWLKAVDFGTSHYTGKGRCSQKVGTPTHWAPEVFGESFFTEADMWSLGVLMYELIAGRLPFWTAEQEKKLKSERDILRAIIFNEPDFSYGPWLECSPQCIDFIKGLLNKNYGMRMTATEALQHPFVSMQFRWNHRAGLAFLDPMLGVNPWIPCFT